MSSSIYKNTDSPLIYSNTSIEKLVTFEYNTEDSELILLSMQTRKESKALFGFSQEKSQIKTTIIQKLEALKCYTISDS